MRGPPNNACNFSATWTPEVVDQFKHRRICDDLTGGFVRFQKRYEQRALWPRIIKDTNIRGD